MNLFARKISPRAVLILGAGVLAAKIYRDAVTSKSRLQYAIKGFVPLQEKDSVIPSNLLLQGKETLAQLAKKMKVSEIVIARDNPTQQCSIQQLLDCKMAGVKLSDLQSFRQRVSKLSTRRDEYFGEQSAGRSAANPSLPFNA